MKKIINVLPAVLFVLSTVVAIVASWAFSETYSYGEFHLGSFIFSGKELLVLQYAFVLNMFVATYWITKIKTVPPDLWRAFLFVVDGVMALLLSPIRNGNIDLITASLFIGGSVTFNFIYALKIWFPNIQKLSSTGQ
jgi:hypothetical protein